MIITMIIYLLLLSSLLLLPHPSYNYHSSAEAEEPKRKRFSEVAAPAKSAVTAAPAKTEVKVEAKQEPPRSAAPTKPGEKAGKTVIDYDAPIPSEVFLASLKLLSSNVPSLITLHSRLLLNQGNKRHNLRCVFTNFHIPFILEFFF
jgi:hypothetical protein